MKLLLLFLLLINFVNSRWLNAQKRYNNKLINYIYRDERNSTSIGYIYLDDLDLFFADLNYSKSVITRNYNNLEFIVGPKGDSITIPVLSILEKELFINTFNTSYTVMVANNNDYMILSGFLHNCGAPLITHINIKVFVLFNNSEIYVSDNSMQTTSVVNDVELYSFGSYQILVKANTFENYTIQLLQNYNVYLESISYTTKPNLNGTFNFTDNSTITFIKYKTGEVVPPVVPSEVGFTKNVVRPFYYFSRSCNFEVGGVDSNLLLKYPYTPDGVPMGGYTSFTTGELPPIPVAIPPNKLYNSYRDDCNQFYPRSPVFLAFGFDANDGASYERLVIDQNRCYSPFYAPELIIVGNVEVQDERFRQCFMLGGELAGVGQDVCARPIAWAKCLPDFLYFGDFCYYKFNPVRDASAKVILQESSQVCEQLGGNLSLPIQAMNSLQYADFDTQAWLRRHYIYYDLNDVNQQFRVPVFNSICSCYSVTSGDNTTACNCNTPAFPICRYHIKHYEVIDSYISHHPNTIKILRDGQSGSPWTGEMFNCICLNGWTGKACQNVTCGFPVSVETDNPLAIFFTKCYSNNRGFCQDADPRTCQCADNVYTPIGNLITGENTEYPCACPAIPKYGLGTINNITFLMQNQACGGNLQGSCEVDDFTNAGECFCATRTRLSQFFNLEIEKSYDGKSCGCRVPKIFTETDIQQSLCNNKGTCCPFGERLDGSKFPCYDTSGCECDNGWGGESCTCITPFDLKSLLPFNLPTPIQFIDCESSNFLIDSLPHNCTLITNTSYYCGLAGIGGGRDIYTSLPRFISTVTNCTKLNSIYNEKFDICGNYTNPFSGRYSARKENRYYNNYLETQPYNYATKGCTNSKCMCDSNHTGDGCFVGISNTVTKALCGETTLPQRGVVSSLAQRCECSPFGENGFFYGDSCECFVKDFKTCNGHGSCEKVNFPYGKCSGTITNDSLNNPFYYKQTDLDNPWLFKENSFIMSNNISYLFKNTYSTVFMEQVYGTSFDTCDSTIKLLMPLRLDSVLVDIIEFNLTLADNTNIIVTNLRGYANCIGLNQTAFYNNTIFRSNCYTSYAIINTGETVTINDAVYELTCVDAITLSPITTYEYGKLYCNNPYQRNIDKALWIFLGEDRYTLQCESEPIKPYDTAFYGLLDEYNSTRIELILGNKLIPLDDLNDKFFDDYLITWVSPYINNSIEDVNIGTLGSIVPLDSVTQLIFLFFETYSTNVIYDFLNERFSNNTKNGIGSPYRVINTTNYYDLLVASRNYSNFYTKPGIGLILPTYRRQFQNLTNLTSDSVNSIIFTPPVNLESVSIYARNGTLCGNVLKPRANVSITVSCGFDPFLYDANYLEFFYQITNLIIQSTTAEEFTIYFSALATEGVRVNIVPENFHGIELSMFQAFTTPYEDHCITANNFTFPTPDLCHSFVGTSNTIPNFGNYYYNDWYTNQGYVPVGTEMNNTLNNFYSWFNLSFTQSVYDLSIIWSNYNDFPLNINVNSSYPALDCTVNNTYCLTVWHTWLAPIKCTFDAECVNNALGDTCVFSDSELPTIGWRNGNGIEKSLGMEGGCKCDFSYEQGFWVQFCDSCLEGYGPTNNCSFPSSSEEICGPGGNKTNVEKIETYEWLEYLENKIPACLYLLYNDLKYTMIVNSFVYINDDFLVSYINDTSVINIINNDAYINSELVQTECITYEMDDKYFIEYFNEDDKKLEFVPYLNYLSFII